MPNPVTQGNNVQAIGSGWPANTAGGLILYLDPTGTCAGSSSDKGITTDPTGGFSVTLFVGVLGVGTYCVAAQIGTLPPLDAQVVIQTPAPIPEYPYGLTLLAILLVMGYGVVRRKN